MSTPNSVRFRALMEVLNRFGAEMENDGVRRDFLRFIDPEVSWEPSQAALQGGGVGLEAVREWLAESAELYQRGSVDFSEIRDVGDCVLAVGTLRVTGKGSGIDIDVPVAFVARFRDGRIAHLKDYRERGEALSAVGLTE